VTSCSVQRGVDERRRRGDAKQLRTASQLQRADRLSGTDPRHASRRRTDQLAEHPVGAPARRRRRRRLGNTATTQPPARGNGLVDE